MAGIRLETEKGDRARAGRLVKITGLHCTKKDAESANLLGAPSHYPDGVPSQLLARRVLVDTRLVGQEVLEDGECALHRTCRRKIRGLGISVQ